MKMVALGLGRKARRAQEKVSLCSEPPEDTGDTGSPAWRIPRPCPDSAGNYTQSMTAAATGKDEGRGVHSRSCRLRAMAQREEDVSV